MPRSQSGSPTNKPAKIGQKMSKITQKTSLSALAGFSTTVTLAINRCDLLKWAYVSKVFEVLKWQWVMFFGAQEGFSRSQSGSPTTKAAWIGQKNVKKHTKPSLSVLIGALPAVKLATGHFILGRWSQVKSLGLKKGFPDHKVAPRPQNWPQLAKKSKTTKKIVFCYSKRTDSYHIGNQSLYFH